MALAGAATAIVAGTLLAWAYIGSVADLLHTTYGQTLLVKVALLVLTMSLGAWNWRRVSPRLGEPAATELLHRSAIAELGTGLLLLIATAVLVALPAPRI